MNNKEREDLLSQLTHLTEYLADNERLHYRLANGKWNVPTMSKEEREGIETEIKRLRKVLGFE